MLSALPLAVASTLLIWRAATDQRQIVRHIAETWGITTRVGQQALSQQTWRSHLQLVEDKAQALELAFETIRRSVQMERLILEQAIGDEPPKELPKLFEGNEAADLFDKKDPAFLALRGHGVYAMYRLSPGVAPEQAKPTLHRLARMAPFFAHYHRTLPWIKSTYVWHKDGMLVGYPGGGRFPADFDPRSRYWLLKAEAKKRLIWTKMYRDKDGSLVITYADPILAPDKSLIAVAAVDIQVDDLLARLFELQGLAVSDALLLDFKGRVRASATYEGTTKLNVEALLESKPPQVNTEFLGGRLAKVYKAIATGPKPSGIVAADGRRLEDLDDLTGIEDLYTYARVKVLMSDDMEMNWYYLVRAPVAPILKPVLDIRAAFAGIESSLSGTIDRQTRRRGLQAILVVAAVLVLASGFALAGARRTAQPLVEIAETVGKISKGDFEQRLKVSSKDEIGQVQAAINEMAAELKQGVFLQNTFKRYVAPSVVEQLLKDPSRVQLGGDRRVMTVFFSDVSGFTSLAEHMSPEALVDLINEYLSAMTLCIFAEEGTIDKYEGDAIVAFWGAPLEQPDHAVRACRAAMDGFIALRALHGKWKKLGLPLIDMRIGLNTGSMIVGNMG